MREDSESDLIHSILLKKIFTYGFIEGVAKGLNKLTILLLPFLLDTFNYGKIGLIISLELLLPFISLLGLERAVLRFYSEKDSIPNFSKTIFLSITFTHALIIVLFACLYLLGYKSMWGLDVFPDFILVTLLVYFTGTNLITLNKLRVNEEHKKYYQGRLYIQVSKFIFILLFVYLTKNYLGYLAGTIISAISANLIFRIKKDKLIAKEKFNKQSFFFLFSFSWPFIFHGIAANLLGNADKFILEHFMSMKDVGLYTLIYSIGSSMIFAYVGVSVYMEPMIYKEKNISNRDILLNKYLLISLIFGLFAYILLSIVSEYILPYFYTKIYTEVFSYIPFIALSYIIYPFYLKSNYKMIHERKSKLIASLSIVSCVFNVVLNIYLIPIYGIYAAVTTTLLSYILQAVMFTLFSNKWKINKEFLHIIVLGIILSASIFFQFKVYVSGLLIAIYIFIIYINMPKHISVNE